MCTAGFRKQFLVCLMFVVGVTPGKWQTSWPRITALGKHDARRVLFVCGEAGLVVAHSKLVVCRVLEVWLTANASAYSTAYTRFPVVVRHLDVVEKIHSK
jgi:hypothetical protein